MVIAYFFGDVEKRSKWILQNNWACLHWGSACSTRSSAVPLRAILLLQLQMFLCRDCYSQNWYLDNLYFDLPITIFKTESEFWHIFICKQSIPGLIFFKQCHFVSMSYLEMYTHTSHCHPLFFTTGKRKKKAF